MNKYKTDLLNEILKELKKLNKLVGNYNNNNAAPNNKPIKEEPAKQIKKA